MELKSKSKTLRFKESIIEKVEELAQKENRTFANMVETILLKYSPETETN
ncbi:hypothetical protein [Maribacter sp. 2308TA10-17]